LNATIQTNSRVLAADDFFIDLFETALEEDELITCISFPIPEKAVYEKFPNAASGYAIVGVLVAVFDTETRVAVTGAAGSVFRATAIEHALATERHSRQCRVSCPSDRCDGAASCKFYSIASTT